MICGAEDFLLTHVTEPITCEYNLDLHAPFPCSLLERDLKPPAPAVPPPVVPKGNGEGQSSSGKSWGSTCSRAAQSVTPPLSKVTPSGGGQPLAAERQDVYPHRVPRKAEPLPSWLGLVQPSKKATLTPSQLLTPTPFPLALSLNQGQLRALEQGWGWGHWTPTATAEGPSWEGGCRGSLGG